MGVKDTKTSSLLRRIGIGAAVGALAVVGVTACGGGQEDDAGASAADTIPADPAWHTPEMTQLIADAQKEGNLVIVAGPNDASFAKPVWDVFAEKFGVKLSLVTGTPEDIATRVLAENQQGLHQVDIGIMGGGATTRLLEANLFGELEPNLVLPEVKDRSSGWRLDYLPFDAVDTAQKYCTNILMAPARNVTSIYYNTDKVTEEDLAAMTTWDDLLVPKYKGQIIMGNVADGVAESYRVQSWAALGQDYFDKLMHTMDVQVAPSGNDRQMADALGRGEYSFMMFPGTEDPFATAADQGLPVARVPADTFKDASSATLGGRLCEFAQPANPAAAKLFINWLMSKDGQAAYNAEHTGENPEQVALRNDVPQGTRSDETWAEATSPDLKIFDPDEFPGIYDESLAWWKKTFGELNLNP
jgi:iron(III) transport system substrate-binding protein